MIHIQSNISKEKYKHLEKVHYEYIESEYNHFISSQQKGKTKFMKQLAHTIGTSLSNLYLILNDGMIQVLNHDLTKRYEFNAPLAYKKRVINAPNNSSKLNKASEFIENVVMQFQSRDNLDSIDEIIQHQRIYHAHKYSSVVCTSTFYNYIHKKQVPIKPIDCPMILKRKRKTAIRLGMRHKGTSISKRPEWVETREVFGHWEGDTLVGSKGIKDRSILTLVERKTRYQIVIPLPSRTSKHVYMAFNKLEKDMGEQVFKQIFQSITFDNGNEFSRYKDIELKPRSKHPRTVVYFAHPYAAWERGSNEHANGLLRRRIHKGKAIKHFSNEYIQKTSDMINKKNRKILGYQSAQTLIQNELKDLNIQSCHF